MRLSLKPVLLSVAVLFVLSVAVAASNRTAQGQEETPEQEETRLVGELRDDGARVERHPETGEVRFVGATKADPVARPDGLAADAPAEEAARAHLEEYGPVFGIEGQARELRVEEEDEDVGQGRASVGFQQVHEGVPVLGGEINAEVDAKNNLLAATGETSPDLSVDTKPGISADEARDEAIDKIARDRDLKANELEATKPKLGIYDPALLGAPGPQIPSLVWRLEVGPGGGLGDFHELVLVDAETGAVLLNFDQVAHAKERKTYSSNNTSDTLLGTLVCDESDPLCAAGNADAKAAHKYAGDTYDFYMNTHNRDSIDGSGMAIVSYVDYCKDTNGDGTEDCPYRNAYWDPLFQQMVYGAGYAAADDAVGHEITHGVTDNESALFYYYQSGAINESLSDVWGEFIDLTNGSGNDTAAVRWRIGEDLPIGVIRNMADPPAFDEPDKMTSTLYASADDSDRAWDNGGVHSNSGVNNKAAYLMTDGGTFNGYTVTGLGITKVAKIYYEAQANLLTSGSDYMDLHSTLRQACANLTGTAGITAANCAEVKDAVDATEMHLQPTNAPAPEAPACDQGQAPKGLFFTDMEDEDPTDWTRTNHSGTSAWDPFSKVYAASGRSHLRGADYQQINDSSLASAASVALPSGKETYLHFKHAYGFDDAAGGTKYDGGVLEYSTDNGATWKDAGPLITHNGYGGTLTGVTGNPLGGRQAFVAESNGYISTRVDLSSLAGQSVRFRFRIATDATTGDKGWFIDDVRIYNCDQVNDAFSDAWLLQDSSATVTGSNVGTTKEPGEPNHAGNSGGRSVWYRWTAPVNGPTIIDTNGSNFDTLLGVYTGNAVNGLTHVASNDNYGGSTSRVTFTANAGTTYRIAVDGWNQGAGSGADAGRFTLNLRAGDAAAPSVYLIEPRDLSRVSGTVTMVADATNVDEVQFVVNGSELGSDPSPPYDEPWNTTTAVDGWIDASAWGIRSGYRPPPSDHHDVVVDNTRPQTAIDKGPGDPTRDGSEPVVFYASENDVQFFCSLDGGAYSSCGSAMKDERREKSYPNLAEGSHTVRVYSEGAGGANDVDSTPASFGFVIDRTPPSAPSIASPGEGQVVNSLTLSGEAEANATVTVYEGATQLGTAKADGVGRWSFTPNNLPAEGAHSFTSKATDRAGNVSPASAARNVTIDRTPPGAVTDLAARPGDKRVDLSWNNPTEGDLAYVRVLRSETRAVSPPEPGCIDTGDLENPTECWSKIYEGVATSYGDVGTTRRPLINGQTYYYTIYARDKAGNWSSSVSKSATPAVPPPDTTAPTVTITTPKDGATYAVGQRVLADYSCDDEQDGSGLASCDGPVPDGSAIDSSAAGQKTFSVTATDAVGNTKTVDRSYTVVAPATYQESHQARADYGRWAYYKNASFSGGYAAYAKAKGDSLTFSFSGTSVVWKTQRLPDGGITDVYLDGAKVRTFDAYSATPQYNITGYAKTGLADGAHTLKLVVTGAKNAASSNTYTEVDRFLVGTKSHQENAPEVSFGPWRGARSTSASGGAYRQSASTAQGAFFYGFAGPYVDLITAKGPSYGQAKVEVYDAATDALVKTVTANLNAATVAWRKSVRVGGLDAAKAYNLKVTSADGKPVVVDAYRAFSPPQAATQRSAATELDGAAEGKKKNEEAP